MKKIVLATALFCLIGNINAQKESKVNNEERFNHSLGFGAGLSTGHGLSYRYFGKKLGVQVNFSPYKDETKVIMSSGLTFLYRIVELEKLSFFAYQANHYYFEEESYTYTEYSYDYYNGSNTSSKEVTYKNERNEINNGVGIGLEFLPSDRIGFNIMGGYGG
ncbi:MAG: hypothetical protein ACPGSO_08080, partial [Vicingaceae bacterium]